MFLIRHKVFLFALIIGIWSAFISLITRTMEEQKKISLPSFQATQLIFNYIRLVDVSHQEKKNIMPVVSPDVQEVYSALKKNIDVLMEYEKLKAKCNMSYVLSDDHVEDMYLYVFLKKNLINCICFNKHEDTISRLPLGNDINKLKLLFSCFTQIKQIEIVNDTNIEHIPQAINKLSSLIKLSLSNTRIKIIIESVTQLRCLTTLTLNLSRINEIPVTIAHLKLLKYLNLSENLIKKIPREMGMLKHLKYLDLSSNAIPEVPEELYNISSLEELYLSKNRIKEVSSGIGKLVKLRSLDFSHNTIETIPKDIEKLSSLSNLNLEGNKLTKIPDEIYKLPTLKVLCLEQNNISILLKKAEALKKEMHNKGITFKI